MNLKIAVVGSREFPDEDFVRDFIDNLPQGTVIISGGARGVDSWAADQARSNGLDVVEIEPEWEDEDGEYNPQAGFERNTEIVNQAPWVVAFWDGESSGTKDSIEKAIERGRSVNIYIRQN